MSAQGFTSRVGAEVTEAEGGRAVVTLQAADDHTNGHDTVHGGALATLIDTAMGAAVSSTLDGEQAPATIEMNLSAVDCTRA